MATRGEFRRLCRVFIDTLLSQLEENRLWPRPLGARRLEMGRDFYYEMIKSLPEFDALENAIIDDPAMGPFYGRDGKTHRTRFIWMLERFFVLAIAESQADRVEKDVFDRWFRRLYTELRTEVGHWREICTVTGLKVIGRPFNLDSSTKLTFYPGWNLNSLSGGQEVDFNEGMGLDYCVMVSDFRVSKRDHPESDWPYPHQVGDYHKTAAILTAIRLLKGGTPIIHCHASIHMSRFPLTKPLAWCDKSVPNVEGEVLLVPGDHRALRTLARYLLEIYYHERVPLTLTTDRMAVAISRYNKSFELQSRDDTFVDLAIALESLLGPSDQSGEISYRIASRAAWLLGTDDEHSKKIHKQVKTLYDLRSEVVHGNVPSKRSLPRAERELKKKLEVLAGMEFEPWEDWTRVVAPAREAARDIIRGLLLACIRLRMREASVAGLPHWPLEDTFDSLAWSHRTRLLWQKAAGVR